MSLLPMPGGMPGTQPTGLLGQIQQGLFGDPGRQAMTAMAMGLLGRRGVGEAGMMGMQAYNTGMQTQQAQQFRELQMQQMKAQMDEQERQRKMQEQVRSAALGSVIQPQQMPVNEMEAANQAFTGDTGIKPGGFDQRAFIQKLYQIDPMQALSMEQQLAKREAPIAVKEGEILLDPVTRQPLFQNKKAPDLPTAVREYEYAVQQGYRGSFDQWSKDQKRAGASNTSVSYGAPVAAVDPFGNPVFFQPDKGGGAPAIVPGVAPPKNEKPMTEAQAKAATFKSQMEAAEKELQSVPINPSSITSQLDVMLAGGVTNPFASPNAQRARQAQEQWSESFLRFKTGAAATKDEVLLNVRTFFPQPGDSKAVVEQKGRMRKQAMKDIEFAASGKAPSQPAADGWSITPVGQ